jgi:uncharacterized protein (DUF2141 family)
MALAVVGLSSTQGHADSERATLTVRLSALKSSQGHVGCALFDSGEGFPKDRSRALQSKWCAIGGDKSSSCTFDPIPQGTYAVVCFHDGNDNRELDTTLFGIPKEGLAVSNDAHGFMGPPKWKDAKFRFAGVPSEIRPKMSY